jgi:tetratricopeptide (TPR) repeat protein
LYHYLKKLLACTAAVVLVAFSTPAGAAAAAEHALVGSYADEKAAYDYCRESSALMNSGNYQAAVDSLRKAIALDPTSYSSEAHAELAECYRRTKNFSAAFAEARTALKLDPRANQALYTMALTHYDMQNYDEAIATLRRYLSTTDGGASASEAQRLLKQITIYSDLRKASNFIRSGRHDQAIAPLQEAARYDPSTFSAQIHGNLAFVYRQTGAAEKAVAEGKKAVTLDPQDKDSVYCVAVALGDCGRFEEGIDWLKRYAAMEPDQARRGGAANSISMFEQDLDRQKDPCNAAPDYLQIRESNYERWSRERLPLKIYVANGEGVPGHRDVFARFVPRALDAWSDGSGNKLNYVMVPKVEDSDIDIVWTDQKLIAGTDQPWMKVAGLTNYDQDRKGLKHATIQVSTVDPYEGKRPLEDGECAQVCLHEMGHALGLDHSRAAKDVMYYRSSKQQTGKLTARDKASIAKLYDDFPVLAIVPKRETREEPKFLPIPSFLPPKAKDTGSLPPPTFLPPPVGKKLTPPLFTPPPLSKTNGSEKAPAAPLFVPPPAKQQKKDPSQLFFVPAPK